MWGRTNLQLSHALLGAVPQPHGGAPEAGFQKLDMKAEGVMEPFLGFMNEMENIFLSK